MVAPLLRCAFVPVSCFLLAQLTYMRLAGVAPLSVWLYASVLAGAAGTALALLWLGVQMLDSIFVGRRASVVALALLALCFPYLHTMGVHLSGSDGLRARGYSARQLEWSFTFALLLLPLATWGYQRFARRRWVDLVFGAVFLGGLLTLDRLIGRYQGELASLVEACAALWSATLLSLLLSIHPRAQRWCALASLGSVASLALLALCLPGRLAEGRRSFRLQESSIDYLDGRLFARLFGAEPPLAELDDEVCARSLAQPSWPPLQGSLATPRNVVLISIDSVRTDYVHRRVHRRAVMPTLGRLSRQWPSAQAYTAYPATALALSAAFTGKLPSELLLSPRPPENLFTLAGRKVDEVFAVVPRGNYFQRPDVAHQLLRGATVHMVAGSSNQTDVALAKLRGLRAKNRSHLLWIHYFDPHEPYVVHPEYDFGRSTEERYASELAFVDGQLARLLAVLKSEGWYDDSLILVFSDHGEAFGEKGHSFHHYLLYPWLTRVPFVMHTTSAHETLSDVHLADIAPTVLHYLGMPRPPHPMSGLSLLAPRRGPRALLSEAFPISSSVTRRYAEQPIRSVPELLTRAARIEHGLGFPSKLSVVQDGKQLILHRGSGATELYVLTRDVHARDDLATQRPDDERVLRQTAEEWHKALLVRSRCELLGWEQDLTSGEVRRR